MQFALSVSSVNEPFLFPAPIYCQKKSLLDFQSKNFVLLISPEVMDHIQTPIAGSVTVGRRLAITQISLLQGKVFFLYCSYWNKIMFAPQCTSLSLIYSLNKNNLSTFSALLSSIYCRVMPTTGAATHHFLKPLNPIKYLSHLLARGGMV